MGIVSDDDFDSELQNSSIKLPSPNQPRPEINTVERGRGNGNVAVPDSLRKIIGETNELDGRKEAVELGKTFGISPSSVSAYAKGATSTSSYDKPKEEIVSHIDRAKERISSKARSKLFGALKHMTDDKLQTATVKDLSGVAKDMSVVIKNMEPDSVSQNNQSNKTFVIYAPQFKKEEAFDTIVVKE